VVLDDLVAGLVDALHTPLGPELGGRRLADFGPRDRLTELDFHLPLVGTSGRFAARAIGEALLAHLPGSDPVLPYATALAGGSFPFDLAGELHGSIDALLRTDDGGHPRYVVVDYKTNRLGSGTPEAYRVDLLADAMAHHHYPLQALLYLVATHRYLRWRQPGYDPSRHLGGAAYLFLRAMVGPSTPTFLGWPAGVFTWRPPAPAVLAVDHLLATGSLP
jgi:exodeoxyribonuclease V beta subunit